jgi:predicted nuclease with TOPRIM domain
LSEALLQCNLEAIKDKLDNVIKQQGEYIIQQAQANAALYEQNQSILKSLIDLNSKAADLNSKADDLNSKADSIASNTSMAAKYAQISATNSAVSVKLQSQMLSYQKSDYWFK